MMIYPTKTKFGSDPRAERSIRFLVWFAYFAIAGLEKLKTL